MSSTARPPTPGGVPLLGNGLAFARAPFEAVSSWADEGPVVRLRFPGRSPYLVTRADLLERVLVERQDAFTIGREQRETFRGVEDDAVTATTGDRWQRLRRALHPAFTWDGIRAYGDRMAERTAEHVDEWADGERFDLLHEMRLLTLRILGDTLLGVDMGGDEGVVLAAADALVDRADPRRFGQLLPDWVPTPTRRRFARAVGRLDDYVGDVLENRPPGADDVRSVLLAARERDALSRTEVRDNLTALLLAGHDSAAVTLTYAWYELDRRPEIRESLVEEVEAGVGTGLPRTDDIGGLSRTRNVIRETLRLYPPAWTVNREATETVELGGFEVPEGTQVMLPQWVLHRDERYWETPETFDPSRWEGEPDRPEYAYFPFGGGPCHCIGMRFARLELALALATMVGRVDLDVSLGGPLTFAPSISLRPETDVEAIVRRL